LVYDYKVTAKKMLELGEVGGGGWGKLNRFLRVWNYYFK
jgi:hypothetical protein